MWPWSVAYRFEQAIPAPPRAAFEWLTDYRPSDLDLMGEDGRRSVTVLDPSTILLIDTFRHSGGPVVKTKLVRLYPDRLLWTSTHITGPTTHSQFLYELRAGPRGSSRFRFTGLQFERHRRRPTPASLRAFAQRIRTEDAAAWRRIARAIGEDRKGR
ncbi:MAG TPA: hypothetical protein VFF67_10780 [Thermoplasmata archaeon]|nr:hypothetical protein [Thermoplasmata archaeon]